MHETKSKMYAWNYVVPWHHTCSGYTTGTHACIILSWDRKLLMKLVKIMPHQKYPILQYAVASYMDNIFWHNKYALRFIGMIWSYYVPNINGCCFRLNNALWLSWSKWLLLHWSSLVISCIPPSVHIFNVD